MIRLPIVLFVATVALLMGSACAQEVGGTGMVPDPKDVSKWPKPATDPYWQTINLVTVEEPVVRHKCHITAISEDGITCGSGRHRSLYKRDDIAAIIEPADHSGVRDAIITFSVAAGLIAGSFFVPALPLVVIMRVFSGGAVWGGLWGLQDFDHDHNHDILVYQRPGTQLALKLR